MKNIYLILILSTLFINIGCDNSERLTANPNSGWIEVLPSSDDTFESRTIMNSDEFLIGVKLNSATNVNGLDVSYNVEVIGGNLDDNSILGTKHMTIEKDKKEGMISFIPVASSKPYVLKFTLTGVDDFNFSVGLSDDSQPIEFILYVDKLYDASPQAFGGTAPTYIARLGALIDTDMSYTIDSTWGPDFVAWATGNPAYLGLFLNNGTIDIASDNSLTISGEYVSDSGSYGTYDSITGIFTFSFLESNLFGIGFQVDNSISPQ